MKHGYLILISYLFFSCDWMEGTNNSPDNEIGTLNQAMAYIGTEESGNNEFLIYLELENEQNEVKYLVPTELGEICEFLKNEFYDFEYEDWEACSFDLGLKYRDDIGRQRARLMVNVSGNILQKASESTTDFFPFELTQLEKIKECPISWEKAGEDKTLAETPWKFIGFIDEDNEIYSHPACEEEYFGLSFSRLNVNDSQDYISPHEFPDALIMKIETFVWFRASSGTKAYYPISNSQFIPTFGLWSNQSPPGPSTGLWDNLHRVPRRMKEKYDSLSYLLSSNDTVDYLIEQNILQLSNPGRSLEALFVAEGKENGI